MGRLGEGFWYCSGVGACTGEGWGRGGRFGGKMAEVDAVQRLEEKTLWDYCCWFDVSAIGSRLMLSGKNDSAAEELKKLL
uniref:Uncharacterized protein n=1 Tax=Tanacetum cinerariifolium TaxID=118510 RepID=A0A699HPS2_TANCI|nr:hypothetical protein [Tanacetum cinerariifolium]